MPVPNKVSLERLNALLLETFCFCLVDHSMSHFLKVIHLCKGPAYRRCLATASPSAITSQTSTKFGRALESGPTLDDFLSGDLETIEKSERVVLGNTRRWDSSLM